jgi:transcription initiation factor TFIID subunit 2
MDLGTVSTGLRQGLYTSAAAARDDVRLVFSNCRMYNPVGNAVRALGDQLSDHFESQWSKHEPKLVEVEAVLSAPVRAKALLRASA